MRGYEYSVHHAPLEPGWLLWQVRVKRPGEWGCIVSTLERCPDESDTLSEHLRAIGILPSCSSGANDGNSIGLTPKEVLNACATLDHSLGWLLKTCIDVLPWTSTTLTLLRDLTETYSPLQLVKDDEVESEDLGTKELGSTFQVEVKAKGVPTPAYQWLKLPHQDHQGELSSDNWEQTGVTSSVLRIENFALEDAGTYKCYVTHRLPVACPPSDSESKNSREGSAASQNILKGIFSRGFEIIVSKGSLKILEEPCDCVDALIGGSAVFSCKAESEESQPVSYQWSHNGKALLGQNGSCLEISPLWMDSAGQYSCKVSNSQRTLSTRTANLVVNVPKSDQQLSQIKFENERILIVEQPKHDLGPDSESAGTSKPNHRRRAAIGDKVVLQCRAVCRHPLKYEWVKQGLRKDLINPSPNNYPLPLLPVALGPQLNDEIEEVDGAPVSAWIYHCIVTCPRTNERLRSRTVKIDVSTLATPERCLPTFKVALVICQEDYDRSQYFDPLKAPKNDGTSLVTALKEMDFQVFAFANITLEEMRNAVEMFAAFIDGGTYALFYYNGHAIGYGNDVYLVGKDTDLNPDTPLDINLLWHGEVETKLDARSPLSLTLIYDCCRFIPPGVIAGTVAAARHPPYSLASNYCIGYGTRPGGRSFDKVGRKSKLPNEGLYMRHLLRHLNRPDLSIKAVLDSIYPSLAQEEDASVVSEMKPEVVSSSQNFSLSAPLRNSACTEQHKRFFQLCRQEALNDLASGGLSGSGDPFFEFGLRWSSEENCVHWVTGRDSGSEKFIQVTLRPHSAFHNEARIDIALASRWSANFPQTESKSPVTAGFQLIPCNHRISAEHSKDSSVCIQYYSPCKKNPTDKFEPEDGPLMPVRDYFGLIPKEGRLIGTAYLKDLQAAKANLRFRMVLYWNMDVSPVSTSTSCLMEFSLPIITNYPGLKMRNIAGGYSIPSDGIKKLAL